MGVRTLLWIAALLVIVDVATAQTDAQKQTNYTVIVTAANSPEAARCLGMGKCYQKSLTCPSQCPHRATLGDGKKACFIDCLKCETVCKHRLPNCYGFGAVCYDPRLVGGDGSMFYFHGETNQDFCLVTDQNLHINGHFIGTRPEGRKRDYTWIQSLGILYSSHKFVIGAKTVASWDDQEDQLLFSFDGIPFSVEEVSSAMWKSADGSLRIERTYAKNVVEVYVGDMMSMLVAVVPITEKEDKAHNYQLPQGNVFAHLDLQFRFNNLSANVDGILGQTYRPDYVNLAKPGVKMPILGGEDRFFATGLLNTDCKNNRFSPFSNDPVDNILMPVNALCSGQELGSGLVCRR